MNSMELNQLCQWADDLYQFVMVMMDHMKQPRDYGTGKILNMVEIHTLSMISEPYAERCQPEYRPAGGKGLCGKEKNRRKRQDRPPVSYGERTEPGRSAQSV